jgi:hypothetical protein
MIMKKIGLFFLPVLCFFLSNCTKDPIKNLSEEESRIYVTNYDTAVSFNNYKTFKIADSVAVVENNQLLGRERTSMDAQFINTVANALQQRGYIRVANSQPADLALTISAITNTSTQVVSYPDYYGGYYGDFWDPFYFGYPGYSYYAPTYYGIYETGETALAIDMVDLKNANDNNNQLRVVWSGLIRGSGIFSGNNINEQINALFNQSTYLTAQ